jgi:murein DD-endopeptidase MepM/ murein hydrolase activator NlpD
VALPGDTLITLASRAGAAPSAFAAANGIVSGMVYAGARYRVPPSSSGSAVPFVANPPRAVTSGRHDTVMAIARRTHTSARDIASLNGLTLSGALRPGTRVLIPSSWRCPVQRATFMNDWGFGREGGAPHQGNDLMAARGTPVVAPVDGVVVRHPNHLGGNAVWLYGSDGNSYYGAHLERYGAQGAVRRGTIIGYVGDTGDARGGPTHLHFEIHPGRGPAVNPYPTLVSACR